MNQGKNQLLKEFEKEFLLYLDGDLPKDRMKYWNQKLEEFPELNKCIEDYMFASETYAEVKEVHLEHQKLNTMIDTAIIQSSILNKIERFISNLLSSDNEFAFGKIAFGSALIIGAIIVSLLSNKPNPVDNLSETFNSELLEWDANFVDDQISRVGTLLKITKDDEYRKYYKYKLITTSVDKNINLINKNIKTLKEELNNKEL